MSRAGASLPVLKTTPQSLPPPPQLALSPRPSRALWRLPPGQVLAVEDADTAPPDEEPGEASGGASPGPSTGQEPEERKAVRTLHEWFNNANRMEKQEDQEAANAAATLLASEHGTEGLDKALASLAGRPKPGRPTG